MQFMTRKANGISKPYVHNITGYPTATELEGGVRLQSQVLEVRTTLTEQFHNGTTKGLCQLRQDLGHPDVEAFRMPPEQDVQELIYDTEAVPGVSGISVYPDRIHVSLKEEGAADWPNIGPAIEYHVGSLVLSRQPINAVVSLPSGYTITR